MRLSDYLETTENRVHFSQKRLEYLEKNLYMCEVHEVDLKVGDGFRLINCSISFDTEYYKFKKNNPNSVSGYQAWEKPDYSDCENAKIVYCETCESNWIGLCEQMKLKRKKSTKTKKE